MGLLLRYFCELFLIGLSSFLYFVEKLVFDANFLVNSWEHAHANLVMNPVFFNGYLLSIVEKSIK